MGKACIVVVATLALAGCAGNRSGQTDTLQGAVRNIDSGLVRIAYVSSSDLASDDKGQRYQAAVRFVRDKQCSSGTANPLFLTSLPMNVRLSGNIAADGKVDFSTAKSEGAGQGVEVLLRASTLADLPNEYLREMSALLQSKGLPDEVMNRLKKEVPGTYQTLTVRINKLVNEFDPKTCGVSAKPATPPAVATAPAVAITPAKATAPAAAPRQEKPKQERSAGIFVPTF